MEAPAFWSRPPGVLARLLQPAGMLYALGTALRLRRPGWRAPVPVICVGNLSAGGAGKTPVAAALVGILQDRGLRPHVVSRGHGGTAGRAGAPHRVRVSDPAALVGDEPLLLAARATVWVCRDRAAAARAAAEAGADVIVMDDGHQNPGLAKDLSIVVLDAEAGFGNRLCIPAGPLREPAATGLARADLVVLLGPAAARAARRAAEPALAGLPVAEASLEPVAMGLDWSEQRVVAFAGIGRPEKVFATLRALGAEVVAAHAHPDHAPYPDRLLRRLRAEAEAHGAQLVTTEKDMARLRPDQRVGILPLMVAVDWADRGALDAALDGLPPRA